MPSNNSAILFSSGLNLFAALLIGIIGSLMIQSARPVLSFIEQIKTGISKIPSYLIEEITSENYL